MAFSRPIITFQVGNYSNYIGTHWFNSQRDYFSANPEADSNVFWKESLSRDKQRTLTPRVLLFDLDVNWPRRSAGTSAVELERAKTEWDGTVHRIFDGEGTLEEGKATDSIPYSSWSDYLEWKLEGMEKVSFPISNYSYNSAQGVLSNYDQGTEIYSSLQDRILDGIRYYAESCDYLEGFHLLFDQDDGFGGITSGILQHLADEFDKKSRLAIGTSPATSSRWQHEKRSDTKLRLMNTALSWCACNSLASLFTSLNLSENLFLPNPQPRKLPYLKYNGNSVYETSSILAASLDTLTTPYFSTSQPTGLADVVGLLSAYGRRMTTFGLSFPLDIGRKTLFGTLKQHGTRIVQSLSPGIGSESPTDFENALGNYFVIRGVPNDNVMRLNEETDALRSPTSETCLEFFSREFCPKSLNVVRSVESPFRVSHPFPTQVVEQTFLATQPKTKFRGKDCWNVGVIATAHNSTSPRHVLERLLSEVDVLQVKNSFQHENLEGDDYAESLEGLKELREAYLPES